MTTFLEDESSAEGSQPREYFDIEIGSPTVTAYYITSGNRDLFISISGGQRLYVAIPAARSEIQVAQSGKGQELIVSLPVDHPLVTRYLLQGIPPRMVKITAWRLQVTSGVSEMQWHGKVTSMSVEGRLAKFRVPSRATETFLRVIPNVTAGKLCPHILYDSMCKIDRNGSFAGVAHKVATTAIFVDGRLVRVDLGSTSRNDNWSLHGELLHVPSGERLTIRSQVDLNPGVTGVAEIEMQMPIPELQTGHSVEVYAGCNKAISQCEPKFGNRHNFGGFNRMPSRNVWSPTDYGFDVTGEL